MNDRRGSSPQFLIFVPSFNRPRFARELLAALLEQAPGRRVRIHFRDDCSFCDYSAVKALADEHPDVVTYLRNEENRARDGLWKTYNEILAEFRRSDADFLIVLQDHTTVVPDFLDRVEHIWSVIPDANKTVLNLPRNPKAFSRWWSNVFVGVARYQDEDVLTSGWIDGSWLAGRRLLDLVTTELGPPKIPHPKEPYRGHPTLAELSDAVLSGGGNIYTPTRIVAEQAHPAFVFAKREPIRVLIPTYNRPDNLLLLLTQIEQEAEGWPVRVDVFDDASSVDYAAVRRWIESARIPVALHCAETNRGKRGFWQTFNEMFRHLSEAPENAFVILQDDAEICTGFFGELVRYWNAIGDHFKIALNIQRSTAGDRHIWQGKACALQTRGGTDTFFSGWFDGMWFGTRDTLEALSYCVHAIDPRRWLDDPTLSSGVGQQLTDRLGTAGYNIYGCYESLVRMIPGPSFMNPEARASYEIVEVNFVGRKDG